MIPYAQRLPNTAAAYHPTSRRAGWWTHSVILRPHEVEKIRNAIGQPGRTPCKTAAAAAGS